MTTHAKDAKDAKDAKKRCLERLLVLAESDDPETAHYEADRALLDLICDAEVAETYELIPKWYA